MKEQIYSKKESIRGFKGKTNRIEFKPILLDDSPLEVDSKGNFIPVPKPNSEKYEEEFKKISNEVSILFGKREKIDQELNSLRTANKPIDLKRKEILDKKNQQIYKLKNLSDCVQKVKANIETHRLQNQKIRAKQNALKFKSIKDVDSHIEKIEKYHQQSVISCSEEKKIMKELSQLRQVRLKAEALAEEKRTLDASINIPSLYDDLARLDSEIKSNKAVIEECNMALEKIKKESESTNLKFNKFSDKIASIQGNINKQFEKKNQLKSLFFTERHRYNKYHTALRNKRIENRKAQEEEIKKKRAEHERLLEEEEMAKKPWEAEIALCDRLIVYLESLSGRHKHNTPNNNSIKVVLEKQPTKVTETSKQEDSAEIKSFPTKSKKKNSKKKVNQKLSLPIDIISSFSMLQLNVPLSVTSLPNSINELREKRAYFDVLPRPVKDTVVIQSASFLSPQKKERSLSVDNTDIFPALSGYGFVKSAGNTEFFDPSIEMK